MLKTTEKHKKYWQTRKINWDKDYLSTWQHPHRAQMLDRIAKMKWRSLLELGCASGPNLKAIETVYMGRDVRLGGLDINPEAIEVARENLHPSTILDVGDLLDTYFSEKSVDVVLTDMSLIYIGSTKIKKAISEIKRLAINDIILIEFHSESFFKRLALRLASGYNAYNYRKLLTKAGFYDVEMEKVDWPGGEPQKSFGYIITAKI